MVNTACYTARNMVWCSQCVTFLRTQGVSLLGTEHLHSVLLEAQVLNSFVLHCREDVVVDTACYAVESLCHHIQQSPQSEMWALLGQEERHQIAQLVEL